MVSRQAGESCLQTCVGTTKFWYAKHALLLAAMESSETGRMYADATGIVRSQPQMRVPALLA